MRHNLVYLVMTRFALRSAVLSVLLLCAACARGPLDEGCGPEFRETVIRGEIQDRAGASIGWAEIRLVEVRGGAEPPRILPIVRDLGNGAPGPLRGHVVRAQLLDPGGATLSDLPVAGGDVRTDPIAVVDVATLDALRQAFVGGGVVLSLETDLAGMERVQVRLPLLRAGTWGRARCS
jgi:hypothetical protein